jgi:threonylcarbamoyladenosine tRNA methylthiotransferase MtaB
VPAEFFVHNLGCKLNRVESDALHDALHAAGARPVARDEAQLVVVNTCTVTGEAEAKTRKAIRQALAAPGAPWVIATGCAIALDREGYESLGERVVAEPDRARAQEQALELLGLAGASGRAADGIGPETDAATTVPAAAPPPASHDSTRARTRRGIKIQDGCDGECSYCVVRVARGPARSLPQAELLEQIRAAERDGVLEVVLTGVNIGAYRDSTSAVARAAAMLDIASAATRTTTASDSTAATGLCQLVALLLDATDTLRIRLSSLEPQHASDELLQLMASSNGRLCAHLHLPLQSGCDRTLAGMARPYDTALYEQRVARARALMPQLALTTDVIVGFPGESDEDFARSRDFCERMGFSRMHVFRYSKRPHTPAAARSDQIEPQVSAERAHILRELAASMQQADGLARVGTREAVLVERQGLGTSESYHRVAVPEGLAPGRLVPVRITAYRDTLLQATL